MNSAAPDLITDRLYLRHFSADDYPALVACWQDPGVVRFIGGQPQNAEMTWGRLLRYLGHWMMEGYGYWAVFDKASDSFVGAVGLQSMRREVDPPLLLPEAGWTILPEWQGRGYAREAMTAVIEWASLHLPGALCCIINAENAPSIALARRLGFKDGEPRQYNGHAVAYFERP
ncbi:N-acetyltransferase [Salmonella enterica subsp. enterica serovar Choleraesuis]|nr:N-acetyltransferase [Salmonella enterica subsp. enterica serovar Choleraesuis]